MRSFIRKTLFSLSCLISAICILSIVLSLFDEKDIDIGTRIGVIGFLSMLSFLPLALFDIYTNNWSAPKNNHVISIKRKFWFGCMMFFVGIWVTYHFIFEYFTNENIDFSGGPRYRFLGQFYNFLADKFGPWLPTLINVGFSILLIVCGVALIRVRFTKQKTEKFVLEEKT